jgi:hypothetical protein
LLHYICYHNTEVWGQWKTAREGRLDSFFTAKSYRPETLVGNCLWVVVGDGSPRRYRLVCFGTIERLENTKRPAPYKGLGRRVYFRVHRVKSPDVTKLLWFERLLREQQSFRNGFNRIADNRTITALKRFVGQRFSRICKEPEARNGNQNTAKGRLRLPEQSTYMSSMSDMEGTLTEVRTAKRGRSQRLRMAALRNSSGICGICRRDFRRILSGRGVRVLQVHHKKQLSAIKSPRLTKLSDLLVVCANCHILLHLDPSRALEPSVLRKMLQHS